MAIKTSDSERELLRAIRARSKDGNGVRVGIGDDCAVLQSRRGEEILVTTDFSIEGRHFHLNTHPPEAIGHKCLARGLSDIASMGGRPMAAFISLAVPRRLTELQKPVSHASNLRHGMNMKPQSWMERFYDGLLALADNEHVILAGGDLSESPTAVADIIVIGAAPKGRAILRSTARAGDILYVTGSVGGAAAELATLQSRTRKMPNNSPENPHFYPQPRLAVDKLCSGASLRLPASISATGFQWISCIFVKSRRSMPKWMLLLCRSIQRLRSKMPCTAATITSCYLRRHHARACQESWAALRFIPSGAWLPVRPGRVPIGWFSCHHPGAKRR